MESLNESRYKVFVVDDNALFARVMLKTLSDNPLFEVQAIPTGREFLQRLDEGPDIVTLDYTLPDFNGKELLEKLKQKLPDTHVIVVSGQSDVATAIDMLKIGAYDYIVKGPDTREKILISLRNVIDKLNLTTENKILKQAIKTEYSFKHLIKGNSKVMEDVFSLMGKAAQTNINVSIFGDTGTGKELVAKGIHYNSKRSNKPFVPLNVASIPDTLIESELFGFEKGAFTGADQPKAGKIEMAQGGTLFLDEVAEMNLNTQAKLLRVLQEREVTRLGSHKPIQFDVRIITATHRNLREMVQKGDFREDLYYRLLGLTIDLPPLRERGNDVLMLAKYFINQFCDENDIGHKDLSENAKEKIKSYPFPGNVRELKAIMELACVLAEDSMIESNHVSVSTVSLSQDILSKEKTLQEYNDDIIRHFMKKYKNARDVARRLGVGKSTIYRFLQKENMENVED